MSRATEMAALFLVPLLASWVVLVAALAAGPLRGDPPPPPQCLVQQAGGYLPPTYRPCPALYPRVVWGP